MPAELASEAAMEPGLTKAQWVSVIATVLTAATALIETPIPSYLKLAIGLPVLVVFAVLLFSTPAMKKVVRKYAWVGTLIAGTTAGVLFGSLVLAPTPPPRLPPGPPPASVVTILMTKEAAAVLAGQPADAIRLYAPAGAFIKDDACTTHTRPQTWRGLGQILRRYLRLPAFSSLRHVDPQVTLAPDRGLAKSAAVTARTTGFITPSAKLPNGQILGGAETWVFTRVNGTWWIKSFTYDDC